MIKRDEFTKRLAENMGTSQKEAKVCLDSVLQTMMDYFFEGQGVKFTGFGSFPVVMIKERICRHPKTGEKIKVPAHMQVAFRPGSTLKMKC